MSQPAGDGAGQALVIFDNEYAHRHSMARRGNSGVTACVTASSPVAGYNGPMNRRRLLRTAVFPVLLVVAALSIAACGGSKKPPAPSSGGSPSSNGSRSSGVNSAYRFSACMRSHGVTNFQDPKVSTNGNQVKVVIRVDPSISGSPSFKSAQKACGHLLPGGGPTNIGSSPAQMHARAQALLAFAGCMRQHGFSKFPDPTSQGQLTPEMLSKAGIDLQQPAIKPAAYTCLPLTHGLLTKADVNHAVSSNGGSQSSSGG
jgi:hypothetical protein